MVGKIRRIDDLIREEITRALEVLPPTEAAKALGIGRASIYRYIALYGLQPHAEGKRAADGKRGGRTVKRADFRRVVLELGVDRARKIVDEMARGRGR